MSYRFFGSLDIHRDLTINQDATVTGTLTVNGTSLVPTVTATDSSTNAASTAFVNNYVTSKSYITGNQNITISGDASGSGTTAITVTLPNINSNTSAVGSSTVIPIITANAKGLVTSISSATLSHSDVGAAPLDPPNFTGTPTAPTPTTTDNSTSLATTAFVNSLVNGIVSSTFVYKGTVDITAAPPSPKQSGYTWRVATGGTPTSGWVFNVTESVVDVGDLVVYDGAK